jgi:hypothetical protein
MNVREDALEAFYEGTKHTVDPSPPQSDFWLPILQFGLAVQAELHDHVYAKRRVERPLILLGGVEPSARAVVRVPFDPATDN